MLNIFIAQIAVMSILIFTLNIAGRHQMESTAFVPYVIANLRGLRLLISPLLTTGYNMEIFKFIVFLWVVALLVCGTVALFAPVGWVLVVKVLGLVSVVGVVSPLLSGLLGWWMK